MTTKLGGVPITGFMTTTDDVDVYPTHLEELGKGGLHSALDILTRDLITPERRTEGMLCYVIDEMAIYQLYGGIDNTNWLLIFTIVDGEVVINESLPRNYIFHGDDNDTIQKSPVLLDTRLDILRIKAANFILGRPNEQLDSAQVLNALQDGYMYNTGGNVTIQETIPSSDLTLNEGNVFLGDVTNKASEVQRLEFDNMPTFATLDPLLNLGAYNVYTGSINPLKFGEPVATKSLHISNSPDLTVGKIWLGAAILPTEDPFNYGFNRPKEVDTLPIEFAADLAFNKLWLGNVFDRPTPVDTIEPNNLPDLTFKTIWRGTILGRPEESGDLTQMEVITIPLIEADIAAIEEELIVLAEAIAALELEIVELAADIALIELEIIGIQIELAAIQVEIGIINSSIHNVKIRVTDTEDRLDVLENTTIPLILNHLIVIDNYLIVIDNTLTSLQGQIDTINTTIANLRLNNILADADVSFYNYKLTNLADPVNDKDGVNLRTMVDSRPYIYISKTNNAAVTNLVSNVWTHLVGNTIYGSSHLFSMPADSWVIYTGNDPATCKVEATLTLERPPSASTAKLGAAIFYNGAYLTGSAQFHDCIDEGVISISTMSVAHTVINSDDFKIYIRSSITEPVLAAQVSISVTAV